MKFIPTALSVVLLLLPHVTESAKAVPRANVGRARYRGYYSSSSKSGKKNKGKSKGKKKSKGKSSKGKGGGGGGGGNSEMRLRLTVTNLTRGQVFGDFFVMSHNDDITPLYTLGTASSTALQTLAEDGDTTDLLALYTNGEGVLSVGTVAPANNQVDPGASIVINVSVNRDFPLVTIASMALNTNDGFVSINGQMLRPGNTRFYPALDAGVEANNELCSDIPGPACPADSGNANPGGGEGYVHIHSGVRLDPANGIVVADQDWRNPVMRVAVSKA